MSSAPTVDAKNRVHSIDAFRGVAILAVVAFHYLSKWGYVSGLDLSEAQFISGGAYGVHLFFVISGVVIGLSADGAASWGEFSIRRFARIYPTFVVALLVTFFLTAWGLPEFRRGWRDLVANLLMEPRLLGGRFVDGVYWSLVVEIKFYAWVALSLALLGKRFWVGIVFVALASQFAQGGPLAYLLISEWWSYFTLGLGVYYWILCERFAPGLVVLFVSLACFAMHPIQEAYGAAFIGLSVALMIMSLRLRLRMDGSMVRLLVKLGVISYSVYLLHQNVGVSIIWLFGQFGLKPVFSVGISLLLVLAFSYLFYKKVELPTTRWAARTGMAIFGNGLRIGRDNL